MPKAEKHKYVVHVVIETDRKVTKKEIREWVEEALRRMNGTARWVGAPTYSGNLTKASVRSVDED